MSQDYYTAARTASDNHNVNIRLTDDHDGTHTVVFTREDASTEYTSDGEDLRVVGFDADAGDVAVHEATGDGDGWTLGDMDVYDDYETALDAAAHEISA